MVVCCDNNGADVLLSLVGRGQLMSLCGGRPEQRELMLRHKDLNCEDAALVAADIKSNQSLTKVDISANSIGGYIGGDRGSVRERFFAKADGVLAILGAIQGSSSLQEIDVSNNEFSHSIVEELKLLRQVCLENSITLTDQYTTKGRHGFHLLAEIPAEGVRHGDMRDVTPDNTCHMCDGTGSFYAGSGDYIDCPGCTEY